MLRRPQSGGAVLASTVRRIEELNYDYIAVGEHVMFQSPTANSFTTLSFAAALTEKIGLLSTIAIAPLYPAGLLAKLTATLDLLSDGRFNLGLGVGGEFPAEFEACGVSLEERGPRTDEFLEAFRALFATPATTYAGKYAKITEGLLPKPLRTPPIWIAGRKKPAMRRAARYGDVWMPYLSNAEQVDTSTGEVATMAREIGRLPEEIRTIPFCTVVVHRDGTMARRWAKDSLEEAYGLTTKAQSSSSIVAGTANECIARLNEYSDAGASGIVVWLAGPDGEFEEMATAFARDVRPFLLSRVP
jgi:alkanesulfonate monooxygenase SsuD/methylene tetrahydromethanopterin reductase-like flavin-dependent oxidoreductase (luciferase family)